MKNRTGKWFECKVQLERVQENGLTKKVTEQYVVEALSYTEAEARITEGMTAYTGYGFSLKDIRQAAYNEVLFADDDQSDRWYKAKLDFITIDERTEKEKRSRTVYLVQAATLHGALKNVDDVMSGTMIDYSAAAIDDTKIIDVFEFKKEGE